MRKFVVRVLKTEFVTPTVKRFVVEKPAGYQFIPGQATDISINETSLRKECRPFTFTSLNNSDYLEFIIKIYTAHHGITEKLLGIKPGNEMILHEVFGDIYYKDPVCLLPGGAGITPFIAIFRQLELTGQLTGNTLLFANRSPEDVILKATAGTCHSYSGNITDEVQPFRNNI